MVVDARALSYQVLVNDGSTDLDVSAACLTCTLATPELSRTGWCTATGKLTLTSNLASPLAESLDPRANPGRWAQGNVVAISINFPGVGLVPLPWRLKIAKPPQRPSPRRPQLEIDLVGDADLYNYRAPEGRASEFLAQSTQRHDLINAALAQAGVPALTDTITAYPLASMPAKVESGSWVQFAGDLAWTANYCLWQQADGAIRAQQPTTSLSPIAHITVGSDEIEYDYLPGDQAAPTEVKTTGTVLSYTPVEDTSTTTPIFDETGTQVGEIIKAHTGRSGTAPVETETHRKRLGDVLPEFFPGDNNLFVAYRRTHTRRYSSIDGALLSEEIRIEEPAGLLIADYISSGYANPVDRQVTAIDYSYAAQRVLSEKITRIREIDVLAKPTQITTYSGLILAEKITETWVENGDWTYSRIPINYRENAGQTAPPFNGGNGDNRPPATTYQPARQAQKETRVEASAYFEGSDGETYGNKPLIISLPGGMTANTDQLQDIADTWGWIRQGRKWPVEWVADLAPTWLQNWAPFLALDITEAGTRRRYLIEGLSIALTQRQAAMSGQGLELGVVASDGSGPLTLPYAPALPQGYLEDAAGVVLEDAAGVVLTEAV
jgi:hypothetical protein